MKSALGLTTLLLGLSTGVAHAADGPSPFTADGWYTWRVDAVEGAGDNCCYEWNTGRAVRTGCDLDGQRGGWGSFRSSEVPPLPDTGAAQFYARVDRGTLVDLRTLGPACPVRSETPWTDLGEVTPEESLSWLLTASMSGKVRTDERLLAIATQEGAASRDALVDIARKPGHDKEREQAIFWMAQLRSAETRDVLIDLMKHGETRALREHAIFAWSQSPAEDRLEVLIDVIEDRDRDLHDRKQALFWLAQTDDGAGVDYIQDLLLGRSR